MEIHEPLNGNASIEEEAAGRKLPGKKLGMIAAIVFGALAALCLAVCTIAALKHTAPGRTDVLGVDVSGKTKEEIQELWKTQGAEACAQSKLSILLNGAEVRQLPLSELGVTVTAEDAAQGAWDAGHGGNFFANGFRMIRSWFRPSSIVPQLTVDEGKLRACAESLKEFNCAPINAAYRVDAKKVNAFYLTKPADGIHVEADRVPAVLQQALEDRDLSPLSCPCGVLGAKALNLDTLHKELEKPVNASYDKETGGTTPARFGVSFDVAEANSLLEQAQPGEEVCVPAQIKAPNVTQEQLEERMFRDLLGSYTTYVGGTSERKNNVGLAAQKIDGYIMNSGEDFSYNNVVGERTIGRGFQAAPAYVAGKTVDEVGGGICQVSSTLYYAAMLSNMEIVTREEHMYAPSYITFGCDATVSWGGPEFVFRNSSDYPIKIVTYYGGGSLTVEIYGTKLDDTFVRISSETLSSTDYKVIYQKTDELPSGVQEVEQTPYTGYYVKTYRNIYDGDGNLISSELEAISDYCARDEIIKVGTKETAVTPTKPTTPTTPTTPTKPVNPDPQEPPVTPDEPITPDSPGTSGTTEDAVE